MALLPIVGHDVARAVLLRAAAAGTLPQSLLLHGPAGIGKQRFALWLAQLLLCEAPTATGPCDECRACRMVSRLEHPDVHWFFPLPRPEGASAEKLREKLEEARGAELAARRANPLHLPQYERAPAHFLASILTLQQFAGVRPALGAHKIFIVGDAEAMVPQESSPEAANAFLKLLEEPPSGTTLILTASLPGALLPTILSRVLPVRLLPLAGEEVERFLRERAGVAAAEAARIAPIANGSIGRALRLRVAEGGVPALEAARRTGRELLEAALAESAVPRLAAAHAQAASGARADLPPVLDSLAEWLRDLLALSGGAPEQVVNRDGLDLLRRAVERRVASPLAVANALDRVDEARLLVHGNVNPQLIIATLLHSLHTALCRVP